MTPISGLAVLTRYDSRFGARFLNGLAAIGYTPQMVVIEQTPLSRRLKQCRFLARKIGWRDAIIYNLRFWTPLAKRAVSGGRLSPLPEWSRLAPAALHVSDINSATVAEVLRANEIDRIVLAQSGLIRKQILGVPRVTLNCHPGRLPDFRGVDVVRWALWQRKEVWVTLHEVDTGVDTGRILCSQRVDIFKNDTIDDVQTRAEKVCIDLLIDGSLADLSTFISTPQTRSEGKQYYLMPRHIAFELRKDWSVISSILSNADAGAGGRNQPDATAPGS